MKHGGQGWIDLTASIQWVRCGEPAFLARFAPSRPDTFGEPSRARRWWNSKELRALHDLRANGASRKQIAVELGRTVGSVKAQLGRFSVVIKRPKRPICSCCKRPLP